MTSREKLVITIECNQPPDLCVITDFLNGIAKEYTLLCASKFWHLHEDERRLVIRNIGIKGNTVMIVLVSTNQARNSLSLFGTHIIKILDYFIDKSKADIDKSKAEKLPDNFGVENCNNFLKLFELSTYQDTHLSIKIMKSTGFWRSLFQADIDT